jgi:DNA polymerase III delta prime subunit
MQQNNNYGRDQIINNNSPTTPPRDPVLAKLLGLVQNEVDNQLAQSLHRVVDAELLNLGKVLEPHQVRNRWIMEEKSIQTHPPTPLPPEMTIAEVFELPEVGQKLLILGEPGSGKTTTLLELTQNLVERALEDTNAPIPVLVNLSSWKDPQQKIFDWFLGELKSNYGLRQELGGQFLRQNQLLPCFDGLDEVAPIRQEACAVELNNWLTGNAEHQSMGVVVCCRREEYEKIVRKRLFLENSVALQPLSDAQIEAYLNQFRVGSVWESVQASPQLQDLLRKPLFLAVFGFVAPRFDFEEWQRRTTDDQRVEYLFDCYWDVAMKRALVDAKSQDDGILSKTYGKKKLPDCKKVRRVLVFAAQAMKEESQTELLIAKIQPTWLRNERKQRLYRSIVGLTVGLMVGPMVGLSGGLSFGLSFGLRVGLMVGLVGLVGLSGGLNTIEPVEAIKIPTSCQDLRENLSSLKKYLKVGLMVGPILGLIQGLVSWLIGGLKAGLILGLILWLILALGWLLVGFFGGLLFWLIRGRKADIEDRIVPNQGIKNSLLHILILTLTALLGAIFFKLLASSLRGTYVNLALFVSLSVFILYGFYRGGGLPLCQHIALRIVLALNGFAPYRYDRLLNYCTERLLLQRIGGRYSFMHPLLQEHFAKMPLD